MRGGVRARHMLRSERRSRPEDTSTGADIPRGSSPKREREYDELKRSFKREGRYPGREPEVAARIVNKQRAQYGETQAERKKDREGTSPDRELPIADYQKLTVGAVSTKLSQLSKEQLRKVRMHERRHKRRRSLLERIDRYLETP